MHFGGKTGCIEKMFVKLEMTRASPGSSLVLNKQGLVKFQSCSFIIKLSVIHVERAHVRYVIVRGPTLISVDGLSWMQNKNWR